VSFRKVPLKEMALLANACGTYHAAMVELYGQWTKMGAGGSVVISREATLALADVVRLSEIVGRQMRAAAESKSEESTH
jgi:hypothetical protein